MQIQLKLFALYREKAGTEEATMQVADGARVQTLLEAVRERFPGLRAMPARVLVAVNMDYVQPDHLLNEGDEVALIPPVAGGIADRIAVVERAIDPSALLSHVATSAAGAHVLFLGTVRDHAEGREVLWLEYEAYAPMAERTIARIVAQARERWAISGVAVEHRVGKLELSEIAVGVAVSAPHRAEAFEAGRHIIDALKHEAPIWKKEGYRDGVEWVDPSRCGH